MRIIPVSRGGVRQVLIHVPDLAVSRGRHTQADLARPTMQDGMQDRLGGLGYTRRSARAWGGTLAQQVTVAKTGHPGHGGKLSQSRDWIQPHDAPRTSERIILPRRCCRKRIQGGGAVAPSVRAPVFPIVRTGDEERGPGGSDDDQPDASRSSGSRRRWTWVLRKVLAMTV